MFFVVLFACFTFPFRNLLHLACFVENWGNNYVSIIRKGSWGSLEGQSFLIPNKHHLMKVNFQTPPPWEQLDKSIWELRKKDNMKINVIFIFLSPILFSLYIIYMVWHHVASDTDLYCQNVFKITIAILSISVFQNIWSIKVCIKWNWVEN